MDVSVKVKRRQEGGVRTKVWPVLLKFNGQSKKGNMESGRKKKKGEKKERGGTSGRSTGAQKLSGRHKQG